MKYNIVFRELPSLKERTLQFKTFDTVVEFMNDYYEEIDIIEVNEISKACIRLIDWFDYIK